MAVDNSEKGLSSRPQSCLVDTDAGNNTETSFKFPNGNNNGSVQNRLDEPLNPTQTVNLMTTVPQNIASRSLGDKHTPTRNSLRHSRMIVMYRNGRIPKKYLPLVIKHYKLVKSMKIITIIMGILMCLTSMWMVLWSPTLRLLDFPYWSAVPVFVSGVVGCFFLGFCPRPYPDRRLGCHFHVSKFISLTTTVISVTASIVVLAICICHIVYLHTAVCTPHDHLNTTCVCSTTNSTHWAFSSSYHYQDLSCEEVNCFLVGIIATSCVLNMLSLILEIMYLAVQWADAKRKYAYVQVPLKEERYDDR
ncbi:uncharacterized protein [Euwallacea fornicatus]|uniref:uncharacterized protein n=1 Tax=Euwallacea fornicatus TaxID=995702 RepID=UPI00338DABEE